MFFFSDTLSCFLLPHEPYVRMMYSFEIRPNACPCQPSFGTHIVCMTNVEHFRTIQWPHQKVGRVWICCGRERRERKKGFVIKNSMYYCISMPRCLIWMRFYHFLSLLFHLGTHSWWQFSHFKQKSMPSHLMQMTVAPLVDRQIHFIDICWWLNWFRFLCLRLFFYLAKTICQVHWTARKNKRQRMQITVNSTRSLSSWRSSIKYCPIICQLNYTDSPTIAPAFNTLFMICCIATD